MSRTFRNVGLRVRRFDRAFLVVAILCIVASASGVTLAAQGLVWVPANFTTPDPQGFLGVVSPAICSDGTRVLPSGGYLKGGTQIILDAHAQITGVCQFWYNGVHYPQYDVTRGINAIKNWYTAPGASAQYTPLWAPCCQDQDYDTRNPMGGSGSLNKTPTILGMYLVDFQTVPFTTNCNVTQNSNIITLSFNVMMCEPAFRSDNNGNIIHVAPTTISIDLPSSMSAADTALGDAIYEWNNRLGGTGVVLQKSTCSSGPHCIPITVDPTIQSCGFSPTPTTDGSGTITGGASIWLNAAWQQLTLTGLRRTFIHEIGHILGLDNFVNNAACTPSTAAMNAAFNCGGTSMDAVTFNDYQPVTRTAYGTTPRTTCGF